MKRTRHLIDYLPAARIEAPPGHVEIQPMTLRRDRRMALFQHPVSSVVFGPFHLGGHPALAFACGIKVSAWERAGSPVIFTIDVSCPAAGDVAVFSLTLDPRRDETQRRWIETRLALDRWAGTDVHFRFRASVPRRRPTAYCWSGWADLRLEDEAPEPAAPRRHPLPSRPHVFLITADALRADCLGCYGQRDVRTPRLDALAADGIRCGHTRAQTGTTLGSYATLLSGRFPSRHGILAEWGTYPSRLLSLPVYLAAHGYHTLFAPSEEELAEEAQGIAALFEERLPGLAQPAQDGAVTVRRLLTRLEQALPRPLFAWVQLFDTHPPQSPPEPFRSMYYDGDPASTVPGSNGEDLGKVRGIESLQDILAGLPRLERGIPDAPLRFRLRGTLDALAGRSRSGPDLARHLAALGPRALGGRPLAEFLEWLARQVQTLADGRVDRELVRWLAALAPLLSEIEADILCAFEGVADSRYPIAMYRASVSYADDLVGALIDGLRERGLYDASCIVFTSPHGELLGEKGIHFHHHALLEPALRVPLLFKPPTDAVGQMPRGGRAIDGVFDLVDLFPTLLDLLRLPVPSAMDGASRWTTVCRGGAIPDHHSVAVDRHALAVSLVRGNWKLLRVLQGHRLSVEWGWEAGQETLFDLRDEVLDPSDLRPDEREAVVRAQASLSVWARSFGQACR